MILRRVLLATVATIAVLIVGRHFYGDARWAWEWVVPPTPFEWSNWLTIEATADTPQQTPATIFIGAGTHADSRLCIESPTRQEIDCTSVAQVRDFVQRTGVVSTERRKQKEPRS